MTDISWPADGTPSEQWPLYTRGNIGEVYPDVVLPLEWDLGGRASERAWRTGAEAVGFVTPDDYGPGDFVVVGVFGGYAYFNASIMRLLGVRTPGLAVDVIDKQFLGDADVPAYEPRVGDVNRRATLGVVRTAVKTLTARKVPLVEDMRRTVDQYRSESPPMDASNEVLWNYLRQGLSERWEFLISSHVINTMQATMASGALTDLCEAKLGDPNLAVALTTGIGDVVSAEPAREMWRLANETDDNDFDERFARFLHLHGHRGPNEFSLIGRDWAAFPDVAMAAINAMRGSDPARSPTRMQEQLVAQREEALALARKKMGWQSRRLDQAIRNTALWSRAREESKNQVIRGNQLARHAFLELLRRAAEAGGVADRVGPLLLETTDFLAYLADPPSMVDLIEERRADYQALADREPPFAFDTNQHNGSFPPVSSWDLRATTGQQVMPGTVLQGSAGAPGQATGRARVVTDPADPGALEAGDVLVAPLTDPSWTPLFLAASAVVVEVGAAMSHSMIVSRELGIPCVVGIDDVTRLLADGARLEVDGQAGTVTVLDS